MDPHSSVSPSSSDASSAAQCRREDTRWTTAQSQYLSPSLSSCSVYRPFQRIPQFSKQYRSFNWGLIYSARSQMPVPLNDGPPRASPELSTAYRGCCLLCGLPKFTWNLNCGKREQRYMVSTQIDNKVAWLNRARQSSTCLASSTSGPPSRTRLPLHQPSSLPPTHS